MPARVVDFWLLKKNWYSMGRVQLRPVAHPRMPDSPLSIIRGQAEAFFFEAPDGSRWILKKFHGTREPEWAYSRRIARLLPKQRGFESGFRRRFIRKKALGGLPPSLAQWAEGAILMPRLTGVDWACLADQVREGVLGLHRTQRLALCRNLATLVRALEARGTSHRDLSCGNVFIDPASLDVHLIDWDSLYHASLAMPANTTCGTAGYTAPFAWVDGNPHAEPLWNPHSDRFALAITCVEFLVMHRGAPSQEDGGLFPQEELTARRGRSLDLVLTLLGEFPPAVSLFQAALHAPDAASCPSPDDWLRVLDEVTPRPVPLVSSVSETEFLELLKRRQVVPPVFHVPAPPAEVGGEIAQILGRRAPPLPAPWGAPELPSSPEGIALPVPGGEAREGRHPVPATDLSLPPDPWGSAR